MIRVLVAVPTAKEARQAIFYDYFHLLQLPIGTVSSFAHGPSIAQNRNLLVKQALSTGCSHIFFLDDDTVFPPDILIKLICHNVDMVTGLMLKRDYPHQPLIMDSFKEDGTAGYKFLEPSDKGLIEIAASGLGCCLMKCKVFSKLEEPFFRLGELEKDGISEDLGFFIRTREIGLKLHCDLDVQVGHMTTTTIFPRPSSQGWMTSYEHVNGNVTFPAIRTPELQEV